MLNAEPAPPPSAPGPDRLELLLRRDARERCREFKYRCAQTLVFGIPVVALQWFGRSLGGPEADRWVGIFQALLAGWIVYIAAAGMLFEGLILLPRRGPSADLFVAAVSVLAYTISLTGRVLPVIFTGRVGHAPPLFHWIVVLLAGWTALRWRHCSARGGEL
jgi:hypothetical protein